jgi:protein SCO1/2
MIKNKFLNTAFALAVLVVMIITTSRAEAANARYKRTVESYQMPDVVLVDQNGAKIRFKELMQSKKPVLVDFIFGTCTTICPILSVSFTNFQQKLGHDSQKYQLVSISIDPEHDTPAVMKEYLTRYRAKPGWEFLSGTRSDIDKVMHAFDAYIPNKMSHFPLTFIHVPGEDAWVRINGLMGSAEFMDECRKSGIL